MASDERSLGRTPLREVHLKPGSYLFILKRAGCRDVRYPLLLKRGTHHRVEVNLYTDAEIGEGFVYIPGGPSSPAATRRPTIRSAAPSSTSPTSRSRSSPSPSASTASS